MPGESVNPSQGGNETAFPEDGLMFQPDLAEPDDQEVEATPQTDEAQAGDEQATEGEPDEANAADDEASEDPEAQDDAEAKPADVSDDVLIRMDDGETVSLADLKRGNMRERDYRLKTSALADKRREVEAAAADIQGALSALGEFLEKNLPPEPNAALIGTDFQQFMQQKVLRDEALKQVESIFAMAAKPKAAGAAVSQQHRAEMLARENDALTERYPEIREQSKRAAFFHQVGDVAREFGFTPEEMANITDHRMYAMAFELVKARSSKSLKASTQGKAVTPPPVPVAPKKAMAGAASRGPAAAQNIARLEQQARKSGDFEDVLRLRLAKMRGR